MTSSQIIFYKLKDIFPLLSGFTAILYTAVIFLSSHDHISQTTDPILKGFSSVALIVASVFLVLTTLVGLKLAKGYSPKIVEKPLITIVGKKEKKIARNVLDWVILSSPTMIAMGLLISIVIFVVVFLTTISSLFAKVLFVLCTLIWASFGVLIIIFTGYFLWEILHSPIAFLKTFKPKIKPGEGRAVIAVIIALLVILYCFVASIVVVHNMSLYVIPHIDVKQDKDFYQNNDTANILIFSKGPAQIGWINVTYSNLNLSVEYVYTKEFSGAPLYFQISNLSDEPFNSFITVTYEIKNFIAFPFFSRDILNTSSRYLYVTEFVPVIK